MHAVCQQPLAQDLHSVRLLDSLKEHCMTQQLRCAVLALRALQCTLAIEVRLLLRLLLAVACTAVGTEDLCIRCLRASMSSFGAV
jgi:hypothetical protein